jgi:hypothetical protein
LFVNKVKIKLEWDDFIKRKIKKYEYEYQFLANKMTYDKIQKKTIEKTKNKLTQFCPSYDIGEF